MLIYDGPGMHKHSRMIAIHDYMIAQGVVSSDDEHTTIPGIWTKLGSLYNLPILDEREDSMLSNSSDENTSPGEVYSPYELPDDKRGNLDESKSPALLDSRRESTITNTDSPASSPAPGRRGGRATRRGGRVSKLQQEVGSSSSGRRSTSKAGSTADGDEPMGDAADEEDVVDEDGGGEAEQSPKPRSARARGSLRSKGGRGPAGRRASTRARGRKK